MSVTLSEVKRAARAHRAPLAGESAGYLVLALADQVLSSPRLIDAGDVQLTDDGGLRVLRGQASSETDAELSLRRALDGLLLVASSGSAALMRAGRRASPVGLSGLVRELEAALIPVNRAAARRALARLQRETARALASGMLGDEEPAVVPALQAAASALVSSALPAPMTIGEVAAEEPDLETRAIALPVAANVELQAAPTSLDSVPSPVWDEPEASLEPLPLSDALTIALEVRPVAPAMLALAEAETVLLDEDVEFIDEEPSEARTLIGLRHVEVQPFVSSPEPTFADLPSEACTRPEPIVIRQALRSLAQSAFVPPEMEDLSITEALPIVEEVSMVEALPIVEEVSMVEALPIEALAHTPALGSLAAELPVLAPELLAALTRRDAEAASADQVVCSAPIEYTEPMPDVVPLSPGVAIVPSRQSDVSELLADFQVGADESSAPGDGHEGLRRAIKELAELDLTPAPFAALIR